MSRCQVCDLKKMETTAIEEEHQLNNKLKNITRSVLNRSMITSLNLAINVGNDIKTSNTEALLMMQTLQMVNKAKQKLRYFRQLNGL